jgi:hypothetical protein
MKWAITSSISFNTPARILLSSTFDLLQESVMLALFEISYSGDRTSCLPTRPEYVLYSDYGNFKVAIITDSRTRSMFPPAILLAQAY